MNYVMMIGHVAKDSENRFTNGGTAVSEFLFAYHEQWQKEGEVKERTSFYPCVLFGKKAEEKGQYLLKGKKISLVGRLSTDTWEKDGQTMRKIYINVFDINLLGDNVDVSRHATPGQFDAGEIPY